MERIIKFIKKILGLDYTLNEQEEKIKEIFIKLLDMPNTDKILMDINCAFLSNNEMHICVAIDGNDVIIENDKETFSIRCSSKFMMLLSNIVRDTLEKNVSNLYKRMYKKQINTLNSIDSKLNTTSEI